MAHSPDAVLSPARLAPADRGDVPRPFWSVIITVHNRKLFLPECLAAVLPQVTPEMEILLADDASEVDLHPLVATHGQGRVTHFRNPHRRGLYGSVNDALARSRGHWIHILHDDDLVLPGFYAALHNALRPLPMTVGLACTRYTVVRQPEGTTWVPAPLREGAGLLDGWVEKLVLGNPLNVPAVVFRRQVFEEAGLFHEDLPYAADWEMYLRLAVKYGWWYLPENLARFRLHRGNQTWLLNAQGRTAEDLRRVLEIAESYVPAAVRTGALVQARENFARSFLAEARLLLERGNVPVGLKFLRETLRLGGAAAASEEVFRELLRPEAAGLRAELADAWRLHAAG